MSISHHSPLHYSMLIFNKQWIQSNQAYILQTAPNNKDIEYLYYWFYLTIMVNYINPRINLFHIITFPCSLNFLSRVKIIIWFIIQKFHSIMSPYTMFNLWIQFHLNYFNQVFYPYIGWTIEQKDWRTEEPKMQPYPTPLRKFPTDPQ